MFFLCFPGWLRRAADGGKGRRSMGPFGHSLSRHQMCRTVPSRCLHEDDLLQTLVEEHHRCDKVDRPSCSRVISNWGTSLRVVRLSRWASYVLRLASLAWHRTSRRKLFFFFQNGRTGDCFAAPRWEHEVLLSVAEKLNKWTNDGLVGPFFLVGFRKSWVVYV